MSDNTITVETVCWCGKKSDVTVPLSEYKAWKAGGLIQRVMPSLPESQRELLISGTCDACWDAMGEEEF